ncbi:hypothetical protein L596_003782 [Steinernema carpocapsae]|uniref:Condensin complex subunit 2 n=1 Tax=Steinernema carpocapsae TaxID=34508 RepID=A0A4U8UTJ1_STECR|nr:hypothetical protein L596_003782 [Steinernema carpocapsae]
MEPESFNPQPPTQFPPSETIQSEDDIPDLDAQDAPGGDGDGPEEEVPEEEESTAMVEDCEVTRDFENHNKRLLNARRNRRSSLSIRFGLRNTTGSSPSRHERHKDPKLLFQTSPKVPEPPKEVPLTPHQRRKLHEEQENAKIVELLAQTNKKWVGNNFETPLIEKLPDAVERQPLNSVGTLLDASAKIYAYKVDRTLQDCCHAKRDIEKPEKNAKKLEKAAEKAAEEGVVQNILEPDYKAHEIKDTDLFRHISSHAYETVPLENKLEKVRAVDCDAEHSAGFRIPKEFSLLHKKTKRRRRPAGAPNSDDEYEEIKKRNEKIRQKCFLLTKDPRMKMAMSDSSDDECSLAGRDRKLHDFFECVQFRNSIVQQDAKKLIMKDADFDPETDEKELYNPRYSKTVRRTGVTAAALMISNVVSSEDGLIMLLHDHKFNTLGKFKNASTAVSLSKAEVNANSDLAGVIKELYKFDKRAMRHLFPSINGDNFKKTVSSRRTRYEPVKTKEDEKADFEEKEDAEDKTTPAEQEDDGFQWRSELLDPAIFQTEPAQPGKRSQAKTKAKKGKKGNNRAVRVEESSDEELDYFEPPEKKKAEVAEEESGSKMNVEKGAGNETIPEDRTLCKTKSHEEELNYLYDAPDFADENSQKHQWNLTGEFLNSLTPEDALQLGICKDTFDQLKSETLMGTISASVRSKMGDVVDGCSKHLFRKFLFGDCLEGRSGSFKRFFDTQNFQEKEKGQLGAKYSFTEDFFDFDSLWHCDVVRTESDREQEEEPEEDDPDLIDHNINRKTKKGKGNQILCKGFPSKVMCSHFFLCSFEMF